MIKIIEGEPVSYNGENAKIVRVMSDRVNVTIENFETRVRSLVQISQLKKSIDQTNEDLFPFIPADFLTQAEEDKAKRRLEIITPFLDCYAEPSKLKKAAKKYGVGISTIYKWRSRYQKSRHLSALVDREGRGGPGKSKLTKQQDEIIELAIQTVYYQKKSISKTFQEVTILCTKDKIPVPNINSLKKRIAAKTEAEVISKRRSKQKSDELFKGKPGKILNANRPFSVVQIDHTKLDIVLVDPIFRRPFHRPWLTLLIDIYSRCPIGYYLSLDPPGNFGTGQAIANAIYTKDNLLAKYGINAEWPCWGTMELLLCDNAGEFHSKMLKDACQAYNIGLRFREKRKPHYGAHIERLLGTFNSEIHTLPGTTFSNSQERKYYEYDSIKCAAFTLEEFELWLLTYVTKVYLIRKHSGIGMSPLMKLKEGLMGANGNLASGMDEFHENEDTLRLDFMPVYERTIQPSGVSIENMEYYHEILTPYINSKEEFEFEKKREKKRYKFKLDNRNVKKIYFLDPNVKTYFEIPCSNLSCPDMSIWEKREIERALKLKEKEIDTQAIINGYLELQNITNTSVERTNRERRRQSRAIALKDKPMPKGEVIGDYSLIPEKPAESIQKKKPKRFENLDHGAFG
jgi:putative transposase